jgi:anti-sigma factor RsiW
MTACARFSPYLSAAADEVDVATMLAVDEHLASCSGCRAEAARFLAIRRSLGEIAHRDPEPPADLVPAILARTSEHPRRRALPLVPLPPIELARVIQDNREVIVQAGAAAIVAAGAAWAIYKGLRSLAKPSPQRA